MTRRTIARRALKPALHMAAFALHQTMKAIQRKACRIMIEVGGIAD